MHMDIQGMEVGSRLMRTDTRVTEMGNNSLETQNLDRTEGRIHSNKDMVALVHRMAMGMLFLRHQKLVHLFPVYRSN